MSLCLCVPFHFSQTNFVLLYRAMIWDEFLRHFRFCDEEDSGLSDEVQKRKGQKNRPKHTQKRIHQAKKNFLEKFKTTSKCFTIRKVCVSERRQRTKSTTKKYQKSLHKSKSRPIFAPRLRENDFPLLIVKKTGSLGEWLKPAVC